MVIQDEREGESQSDKAIVETSPGESITFHSLTLPYLPTQLTQPSYLPTLPHSHSPRCPRPQPAVCSGCVWVAGSQLALVLHILPIYHLHPLHFHSSWLRRKDWKSTRTNPVGVGPKNYITYYLPPSTRGLGPLHVEDSRRPYSVMIMRMWRRCPAFCLFTDGYHLPQILVSVVRRQDSG